MAESTRGGSTKTRAAKKTAPAGEAPLEQLAGITFDHAKSVGLDESTTAQLNGDLDPNRVKQRQGMSYLTVHDVVRTANRIFGFGKWGHEVVSHELIGCERVKNAKSEEGWYTGYRCTVRLTVDGCVPVSGVGYGDAFEKQWSGQITTHELACKEAESDALKRAFKNFGDQFGLILYAKADDVKRIAAEKAEADYNAPAAEFDVESLCNMMGAIGKDEQIAQAIADEEAAHGHVRHGWVQKALDRAVALTNETSPGASEPPPPVEPAKDESSSQTDDPETAASPETAPAGERQPLEPDDRPAKPDEIAALLELADKAGPAVAEKVQQAVGRHRAQKVDNVVSGKWLGKQVQALMRKLSEQQTAADVEQAFEAAA